MIRLIVLVFSFLLVCSASAFSEDNLMFEKANQLYRNKLYDSSADLYQRMIADGYCHADLYYNAGNAFYRIHKIGMAVWCYKKALQIDYNVNYQDNLLLAQKRIKNNIKATEDIFFVRWWKYSYNFFSVNKWAVLTMALFILSILLLTIKNILKKHFVRQVYIHAAVVLTGLSALFLFAKYYQETMHYHGIIIQNSVLLVSASKALSIDLSEGIEVEFMSRKGAMLQVKIPDGRVGTIPASAFKRL